MRPSGSERRSPLAARWIRCRWVVAAGLLGVLVAPDAGGQAPATAATATEGEGVHRPELPDLAAVPEPVLEGFEPAAAQQLRALRLEVEGLVQAGKPESVDAFGVLCELYLGFELSAPAEACLLQEAALRPGVFRWRYYLGMLYARDARLEEALANIEAALALHPDDVPALLRAGDLYLQLEQLERAEGVYRTVLEGSQREAGQISAARWGLGRIAMSRGDAETAARLFEAALEGQPEGSVVHYYLGLALRSLGDVEGARSELGKNRQQSVEFLDPLGLRLKRMSGSRQVLFTRGVEALDAGQPQEAVTFFQKLLESDPDDAEGHYNLARAEIELGELAEAERHLRRAVLLWPDFFDAHFNLAVLLGRTGRQEEAAQHLERAVALDPEDLATRVLWARVLAGLGQTERAVAELEEVLRLDATDADARLALAAIDTGRGDHAGAALQYGHLLELTPDDPRVHLGRARSLLLAGSYGPAVVALDEANRRFPENLALSNLLARLLAACPDPAIRDPERALALAQRVVDTRLTLEHAETLAMALAAAGRFDEAARWQHRVVSQEEASTGTVSPQRSQRLELYEAGRPVLAPWLDEEKGRRPEPPP